MRPLLAFIFLLTVVMAKDNFIYDEDRPDFNERLTKVEENLTVVQSDLESLKPLTDAVQTNQSGIKSNAEKLYDITVMNRSNGKKISDIAGSLASIKEILADSTKLMAGESSMGSKEVVVTDAFPEVESVDLSSYAKEEALARVGVEVDNLMARVSILEKKSMTAQPAGKMAMEKEGFPALMDETKTALLEYFEYYVIATVVLFFMMFIIIFSLVGKTRHLHLAIEELANRN